MQRVLFCLFCLIYPFSPLSAATQTKEILINGALIKKIKQLKPDSSNAYQLEQLLGPAAACLPKSQESWVCQWKGSLASNRLENTLNVSFEAGMITEVRAIDKEGGTFK
ncbi:hypothetical protein BN59_03299 [Legionella massiliensis]|uniref:Uncharacterized protein n=1 Tax=Legionella massiliensis TaxID=1034943 RepID=A0A078L4I3_9GAMM|nr:hypothetical protein [Legionella massiliensis]CDZ78984.1 hypothetical protein BN59_03299 [Legionella massiliensis]CEE14722.1 hypothetical protein BN1094_03299 [Legionella massiliensis]